MTHLIPGILPSEYVDIRTQNTRVYLRFNEIQDSLFNIFT